jgi:gamma-glutamylcyclotransferase
MKYFAYDANMDEELLKEREIAFEVRRKAILKGYSLVFNKQFSKSPQEGKGNIVEDKKGVVEGIFYEIPPFAIKKLDYYAGYPKHYQRITITVEFEDGKQESAITFVAHPDWIKSGLTPTKSYISHLLAGKDFLSPAYYEKLKHIQTLD